MFQSFNTDILTTGRSQIRTLSTIPIDTSS